MNLAIQYLDNYNKDWGLISSEKGNSGYDLRAAISEPITLKPGERKVIPCGIKVQLIRGLGDIFSVSFEEVSDYEIQIRPRSGLAAKKGITIVNTPGTVDFSYRGEIMVILHNTNCPVRVESFEHGGYTQFQVVPNSKNEDILEINPGDRIAQMVVCPIEKPKVCEIASVFGGTERGEKGFGSSGVE